MSKQQYLVKRFHIGDRPYHEGETRTAAPAEVQHLIDCGVLAKKAPSAKNKAEPSNKNKKAGSPKTKGDR